MVIILIMTKNKIYTFMVVAQGDGKPGELEFTNLFTTRSDEAKDELCQILLERQVGFKREAMARNRREVVVTRVDKEEAERWQTLAGRNGLKAQPVHRGQVFPSATAASGHVGLRHNEVAMMLSRVAATGEKQATVRGVTFAYRDDTEK